jgi:tripartite-type tricarboxylate transporter receptor subunit TctC
MRGLIAVAAAFALVPAGASQAADYFAGKKITVSVPATSGGTYHVYCQLVAAHIARHIPGNPTVITQNRPGAGGAVASAFMFNVAAKDGTEIAMMAPGSITAPLYNKINYDARKFEWLGSVVARSNAIWVWHAKGVRTLDDLRTKTVKMGSTGFGAGGSAMPRFINTTLGTKMEIVYGYRSGGEINLGIERGEVDGRWNFRSGFLGVRPQWIAENKIIAVIATGPRDVHHKNIPHIRDLLKPGSIEQRTYDLLALDYEVGQAFYLPPGTPGNVVEILKAAFWKMVTDPAFKKDIEDRRIELEPLTGPQVDKLLKDGFAGATPDVLKMFREIFYDDRKKKG